MFLRLLIVNKQFSILAISQRLVFGGRDHREPAFGLSENGVDFLEGAVSGFGVEEVDDWEDECVDDCEDNVRLVPDG